MASGGALNSGRCARCNARMGWPGDVTAKPPCPKCGHKPTPAEIEDLQATQAEMDRVEQELLKRRRQGDD